MARSAASRPVHVFKFGGSSVATAARIRRVVELVNAEPAHARRVVVVSALGGVTDQLISAIEAALARSGAHETLLADLRARHQAALADLLPADAQPALRERIDAHAHDLGELLDGVYLLRECTRRTRDAIIGTGERMSAPLVAAAFRAAGTDAVALDATEMIRTDDTFGEANVRFDETNTLVQWRFQNVPDDQVAVVTGFIGATERGVLTTLGRSGSDYTATLLAGALQAERVVIWTDVDGVLSADPRLVPSAFTLPALSYREAAELAYFGAKVLHPRTMRPLHQHQIPLHIKNTLNPSASGTVISTTGADQTGVVKAVSAIRNVAVVMLEGAGMMGVPGISARAFGALAARSINVLMISQASSEQSICMVVRSGEAGKAVAALEAAFELELSRGDVSRVHALPQCAVVSAVGDQMRMQPGLAGRMFATLGQATINVLAIAQGAAETNISAVVRDEDVARAVRALHEAFALDHDRAHVFVLGAGNVGRHLLRILADQAPVLLETLDLNLCLAGVSTSQRAVYDAEGLDWAVAADHLGTATMPAEQALQTFLGSHLERRIVIDASASEVVARRYAEWLEQGISVVTPNKRANTLEQAYYDRLRRLSERPNVAYYYETTVGAGLPILSTLRDLLRSGDAVLRIDGLLSGTLAFVFNGLAEGRAFSEMVQAARARGYTEPDPRDDLGGEDVARKLLILAREAGLRVERAEVEVESLVPPQLADVSAEAFLDRLVEGDAGWQARVATAAAAGQRLHYVGQIHEGRLAVGVKAVGPDEAFHHVRGTDNLVVFTTRRYHERPLVVMGAGAGPEVTAAGVLADVVRVARAKG